MIVTNELKSWIIRSNSNKCIQSLHLSSWLLPEFYRKFRFIFHDPSPSIHVLSRLMRPNAGSFPHFIPAILWSSIRRKLKLASPARLYMIVFPTWSSFVPSTFRNCDPIVIVWPYHEYKACNHVEARPLCSYISYEENVENVAEGWCLRKSYKTSLLRYVCMLGSSPFSFMYDSRLKNIGLPVWCLTSVAYWLIVYSMHVVFTLAYQCKVGRRWARSRVRRWIERR